MAADLFDDMRARGFAAYKLGLRWRVFRPNLALRPLAMPFDLLPYDVVSARQAAATIEPFVLDG